MRITKSIIQHSQSSILFKNSIIIKLEIKVLADIQKISKLLISHLLRKMCLSNSYKQKYFIQLENNFILIKAKAQ